MFVTISRHLLLISTLILLICALPVQSAERLDVTSQQSKNLGIVLAMPSRSTEIPLLQVPARVTIPPEHEYVVSAPQAGLVSQVTVAAGEKVRKGQRLAQINSPELLVLQRDMLADYSELQLANGRLKRDRRLLKAGVIAKRRLNETRNHHNQLVTALNEAKQLLRIAGMSARDIDQLLRSHKLSSLLNVYAPAAGVVVDKSVISGQRVDALSQLFRVADLTTLWLDIDLPQQRIDTIKVGDQVEIEGTSLRAPVTLIGQSVDPVSQNVSIRAVIKRADGTVRPGQKVSVRLLKPTEQPLFSVPLSALVLHQGKRYLFVAVKDGYEVRAVEIAGRQGESVTLQQGLQAGEQVVVKGAVALKAFWQGMGGGEE